jgi:hypothetical protein
MGYGPRLNSGLRGATQASREAVKRLKPWQGGDDSLWRLHKLDNIDKHRLLVPVGSVNRGITFSGFGKRSINSPVEIFAEDRQYPLKDGAEVFRIMKQAIHGAASKDKFGITFSVAFGEGSVVNGEPVVPTVRGLVEHVRDTIHRVISEIGSA